MSDTDKKVKAFAIKNFNDAGTKERFEGGSIISVSPGAFTNYEAAGLVRKPTAEDTRSAAKPDA